MLKLVRSISLTTALLFALPTWAHAVKLATAFVFTNDDNFIVCTLTNAGTKEATKVTVEARSGAGAVVVPVVDSCGTELAAGASCFHTYDDNVDAACMFSAKGKVRGSIQVYAPYSPNNTNPVMALPATK